MGLSDGDYLLARVEVAPSGCWVWQASCMTRGYGIARGTSAHRLAYRTWVGPIPEGLQIDHLCHGWDSLCAGGDGCVHRKCCNPGHLEVVTAEVNTRRGRSPSTLLAAANCCARGHEFTPENTYRQPAGRGCKACRSIRKKVYTVRARIKRQEARNV